MPIHIFNTFNDPVGLTTVASGVNDADQIVGWYQDATTTHPTHGFLESGGTYTTLDDPLAAGDASGGTFPSGINAKGQIVGFYFNATGTHGFLLSGGTYTTIDVPFGSPGSTFANGINDIGQIVGQYEDANFHTHGFLYSGGNYFTFDDPSAPQPSAPLRHQRYRPDCRKLPGRHRPPRLSLQRRRFHHPR
jgi:probable HAF family extracellular repeat protein